MQLLGKRLYKFSSAISEDLLISISMASHKNFKSQQELADHYQQIEVITDDILHSSFGQLDRALFTSDKSDKSQNLYGNHLIKLNNQDNMTTPIMHAFPANELIKHINHGNRILDAGTGLGYFAFLLATYIRNKNLQDVEVHGIDVDTELILNCQRIQNKLQDPFDKIVFKQENILSSEILDYDVINVGFGINQELIKKIQQISKPQTVHLICPLMEETSTEQWLTYLEITKHEIISKKLMKCLFQPAKLLDHVEFYQQAKNISELQEREKHIESEIKKWNKDYVEINQTKPTLEDMRKDTQFIQKMKEIKDIKREIRIAQRPME